MAGQQQIIHATTTPTQNTQYEQREWSELPQAMLHLISKKLPDIIDFIRFHAVCPLWRSSSSISDFTPQLFWFLRERVLDSPISISIYKECFPTDSTRFITIACPELQDKEVHVSWYVYLLALDDKNSSLSLFNPLDKRVIALPPSPVDIYACRLLCIGSDHVGNIEYVVVSMFKRNSGFRTLGLCEVGDDNWKTLELGEKGCACTYYDGMFFVNSRETNVTEVTDVRTGSLLFVIPPPEHSSMSLSVFYYFVESCGKLLAIRYERYVLYDNSFHPFRCEIHEFDYGNGNPKWIKINSIGDQFLYLQDPCGGLSLNASDFPVFRRNCIYFLEHYSMYQEGSYLVEFDMSNGSYEELPFPDGVVACFVSSLL